MQQAARAPERPDAALIRALEGANYHPLWDRYQRITPMAPKAQDAPMLWRWKDFEPLAARAAKEVPIEDVERRAIICVNPAFGGKTVTTSHLIAAFTVLEPGDQAVPHRHTAAAIRFSTRAEGAVTIVNGRRCEMREGDLILTPPMCWHGHHNESDHRTVWFDAANMPLICDLDASFFEPGKRDDKEFWKVDEGDERLYAASGLAPAAQKPAAAQSPKYRYPGAETRKLLEARWPRRRWRENAALRQPGHGRRCHAHARLLCQAARAARRDPDPARDLQPGRPRGVGRRPLDHRRVDLRVVAARRSQHSALDLGEPRGARRRRRFFHCHRPRRCMNCSTWCGSSFNSGRSVISRSLNLSVVFRLFYIIFNFLIYK